jgi:hypothetical protein
MRPKTNDPENQRRTKNQYGNAANSPQGLLPLLFIRHGLPPTSVRN